MLGLVEVVRGHEHGDAVRRPARRSAPRSGGATAGRRRRSARRGTRTRGSCSTAQPRASRCFQPPGSAPVSRSSLALEPGHRAAPSAPRSRGARREAVDAAEEVAGSRARSGRRRARSAGSCSRCGASPPRARVATSSPSTRPVPEVGREQAAQHADRGGLAGAVGAQEAEHLALARPSGETWSTAMKAPKRCVSSTHLDGVHAESRRVVASAASAARMRARNTSSSDGSHRAAGRSPRRPPRRARARTRPLGRAVEAEVEALAEGLEVVARRGSAASARSASRRGAAISSTSRAARRARSASGVSTPSTRAARHQRDARAALGLVEVGRREQDRRCRALRSSARRRQKSRRETGSTPVVGSSSTSSSGVWTSVQASASFCFMPPESRSARRSRNGRQAHELEQLVAPRAPRPARPGARRRTRGSRRP